MDFKPSQLELERQARIEENKRRMAEIGLSQAVDDIQASQQAEFAKAARAPPKKRMVERVLISEEDLRRSSRDKKAVNYNEQAFFQNAEAALERTRGRRTYLVPKAIKVTGGGGGRAVRCSGWSPCMGCAGFAAMERCQVAAEEHAQGLANTAFVKSLSQSMVSGGFWCNAPRGMTPVVAQELGVDYKCELMAYLPAGQSVPEDACHTNLAGDGWTMVWLPRKGEFGFSGGWRSFSLDMKLFPGDCVVVELVPKAQHRGDQGTKFSLILHVFRALDYETDGEKEARQVAQAHAEVAVKQEVKAEVKAEEGVGETARPEDQPTQPLTQEALPLAPRPEGSPAAVAAAAAELSGEPQQAQQAQQGVQQGAGGMRKRQAKLADGAAKRTRRSLSTDGQKASPAAAAAAGGSAAAGTKGRGSGGKKQGAAAGKQAAGKQAAGKQAAGKQAAGKQAAAKKAAGAGKKQQNKKAAATAQEEESYDVERILAVRPAAEGSGKLYLIKWLGWEDEWNSWEPRHHLDRPLTEYVLADGLTLADLE